MNAECVLRILPYMIEDLGEGVHKAWMAEKSRRGFADHPQLADGQIRCVTCLSRHIDVLPKHHPDMVPYAQLPEDAKEYYRMMVKMLLDAIANLESL